MENEKNLKLKLLTDIATCLHECGVSSHQLESTLAKISETINCQSNTLISPTSISISLNTNENQISNNIRITNSGINFSKLSDVQDLIKRLYLSQVTLEDAVKEIDQIKTSQENYPTWLHGLAFGLNAIGLCVFFKIPYQNMPITFLSGLLAGIVFFTLVQSERWNRVALSLAAFIPTLFLFTCSTFLPQVEIQNAIFASLIILIPGLSLTVSLTELASSHLISGTARLMGAIVDFFKISLGVLSAWKIGQYLNIKVPIVQEMSYHISLKFLAILLCSICLTVLFNAKKKDFFAILVSSSLSLFILELTAMLQNQNFAIFVSALVIGMFSNQVSKSFKRPVQIFGLPAMILLVPGSIALKGINIAAAESLFHGFGQTINALTLAVMIVAGLFLADTIVPEKR